MDLDTEIEIYQRIDVLEAEKHSLTQQIKQLENAFDKEKKFHRKFAEDVIHSEEVRNLDFEKERKELLEDNKRLVAENRQLTKDKCFYKTSYDSLMREDDSRNKNHSYMTRSSSVSDSLSSNYSTANESASLPSMYQRKKSKMISKLSEKTFEENKKLKLRTTKLTRDNASLRLKVKQLENFKNKIQNKTFQHEADKNELQNLIESTKRTNGQIFNAEGLSKLGELS